MLFILPSEIFLLPVLDMKRSVPSLHFSSFALDTTCAHNCTFGEQKKEVKRRMHSNQRRRRNGFFYMSQDCFDTKFSWIFQFLKVSQN